MFHHNNDITFRDLNKNGRLDPYEDPRRPSAERVEDLLGQMTLEEKAGQMFHTFRRRRSWPSTSTGRP